MERSQQNLPQRKHLPHEPPVAVSQYARDAHYFLTVCVKREAYGISPHEVGKKGPLTGSTAVRLLCALQHYATRGTIYPSLAVVMPDHLHLIAAFPDDVKMSDFMRRFKCFTAKACSIEWQSGFFDHRLRSRDEFDRKREYVARNPERKGLCASWEEWAFQMAWN